MGFKRTGLGMYFRDYEFAAKSTASFDSIDYLPLGLAEECGELIHEYARVKRVNGKHMDLDALESEVGDVLWMLSQICRVHGFTLEEAAAKNLDKLKERELKGAIHEKSGR